MTKKKLLIIAANGLGKSGVPNVICQVVEALKDSFEIDIVVFNSDDYYKERLVCIGAKIIRVDLKEPDNLFKRLIWRFFAEKLIYRSAFLNLFTQKKYDVVHSFKEYDSAYIFLYSHKFGIEKRTLHCNNEIKKPSNIFSRIIFNRKKRIVYKYTTQLLGVSSECCGISYPGLKSTILFNSYDEFNYNLNVKNCLKNDELVLTQVATFSSRKNQLFTLDVVSKIVSLMPSVRLCLVGFEVEQGYLNKIRDRISELSISENVNIIDGTNGILDCFRYTSFFLLPSIHEAAPISLVEAQACGILCFASDTITTDMDCGGVKYLPISSPNEWAKEIISAFSAFGNSRKGYNMERFSSSSFKNKLLDIYEVDMNI